MTSKEESALLKKIGFWMNRVNDAWSMGEANWAKGPNGDVLSKIANNYIDDLGSGLLVIEAICKAHGIDPKRHRWHGKG